MRKFIVYVISEKNSNTVVYVGVTARGAESRFNEHLRRSDRFNREQHIISVLEEDLDVFSASKREQHYIQFFNTTKRGYNKTHGGLGKDIIPTEETKQKVSASLIGNQRRKGIPHTEEYKARMSEVHKGVCYRAPGFKASEETKAKMSAAQKGMKRSEENVVNNRRAQAARKQQVSDLPIGVKLDKRFNSYYVIIQFNGKGVNFGMYKQDLERAKAAAELAISLRDAGVTLDKIQHPIFTAKRFRP